jgi:hypothetical protein
MSLCGKCNLTGNYSIHTCSIDGINIYCVYCIWAACEKFNLQPKNIKLEEILNKFEEICWDEITAKDVCVTKSGDHWERIRDADLSYPIRVYDTGQEYVILDGCHRFVKTYLLGKKEISAVIIPKNILDKCVFIAYDLYHTGGSTNAESAI